MKPTPLRIRVPLLTRVEGEGALELDIEQGQIRHLQLQIFEPPRYFEKFLEGRDYRELPDIVARICGICPVAYQMSAAQAVEQAFRHAPNDWLLAMRRLLYCGEWLQSHALHIHMLALPDFLGCANALEMAGRYPQQLRRGLALQQFGNRLIELFGGRSVHPVGVCAGGFHSPPDALQAAQLARQAEEMLPAAWELLEWLLQLPMPEADDAFCCVALRHADEYPMYQGRIVSSEGLDITADEFAEHFQESHLPHSTALFCHLQGQPYLVGPLARLNLNPDQVPEDILRLLARHGLRLPSRNMFHSLIARAVELLIALREARRLLTDYRPQPSAQPVTPRAAAGYGCTEAPRGLLWHHYRFDETGRIRHARIVPPTSQNQARIEQDLRHSLARFGLQRPEEQLRLRSEMLIRNYDPCISCATHFLRLKLR
jgi:sulfhydrogenase subunit alpha